MGGRKWWCSLMCVVDGRMLTSWAVVAVLGGDGGNLGLGTEEGRPHHRSAAFTSWPSGSPQSSFLKQFLACCLYSCMLSTIASCSLVSCF